MYQLYMIYVHEIVITFILMDLADTYNALK